MAIMFRSTDDAFFNDLKEAINEEVQRNEPVIKFHWPFPYNYPDGFIPDGYKYKCAINDNEGNQYIVVVKSGHQYPPLILK